jgi:recombination protein RecT
MTTTEVATTEPKPLATQIRETIERQGSAFAQVMPATVDADRFARLVLTAVKATPQLMDCFETKQGQTSVLLAAMKAASLGIEPNTELQHCWLLPRRNRQVMECQLQIGYRGYIELARRSGEVKDIYAEVVREGDLFTVKKGLHRDLVHEVPAEGDRGKLTHAYAVAHFMSGGFAFEVLDEEAVGLRRAQSDSWRSEKARQYSPWTTATESMWKKSAVRALVPYLPLSAEVQRGLAADEARLTLRDREIAVDVSAADEDDLSMPAEPLTAAELTGGDES